MTKAIAGNKIAGLGIEVISVATGIHEGGSISFTNAFKSNTSRLFNDGNPFCEGLAAVELHNNKWCHITNSLKPAYRARYDWLGDFHHGLAPAAIGDDMFHIDRNGIIAYKKRFIYVGNFCEGLAVVKNHVGKMFHILPNGQPAYPSRFHHISDFSEGLAVVQSAPESKFYFIDHHGLPLGMGQFEEARLFQSGLAAVKLKDGIAYHINHAGQAAYRARFQETGDFSENLAPAAKREKCDNGFRMGHFHISRTGKRIYNESYDFVHNFRHGIAIVRNFSRKTLYIDMHGHKVKR